MRANRLESNRRPSAALIRHIVNNPITQMAAYRHDDFHFIASSLGGLWCLRVWLRVNAVDHRIFGEDELWIGKDIDFSSVPDASFVRHRLTNPKEQVYSTLLGNAHVNFIVRCARTLIFGTRSAVKVTLNTGGKV